MVEVGAYAFLLQIGSQFLCALAITHIHDGAAWYAVEDMYYLIGFLVALTHYITDVGASKTLA